MQIHVYYNWDKSARNLDVVIDSKLSLSAHVAALCCSGFYHLRQLRPVLRSHMKQPEHLSRHLYQVVWTIVIHCCTACVRAASAKFSPSRMPPLGFSPELGEGTTSCQFLVSCTGFLSRDVSTSSWHVSFTRLSLARHLRTWLTTYTWFRKVQDVDSAHPPTDRVLFHGCTTHLAQKLCCRWALSLEQPPSTFARRRH